MYKRYLRKRYLGIGVARSCLTLIFDILTLMAHKLWVNAIIYGALIGLTRNAGPSDLLLPNETFQMLYVKGVGGFWQIFIFFHLMGNF